MKTLLRPLIIAIACALVVRGAFFRVYGIPSASMAPTLQPGDQIVVTPYRAPFAREPKRGDVVVFRSPFRADELLIKRIIATPAGPHLGRAASSGAIAPQIVPAGCYFVAGDNRENSWDSRTWGVLPRELISGRARLILWSCGGSSSEPQANAAANRPRRLLLRRRRQPREFMGQPHLGRAAARADLRPRAPDSLVVRRQLLRAAG